MNPEHVVIYSESGESWAFVVDDEVDLRVLVDDQETVQPLRQLSEALEANSGDWAGWGTEYNLAMVHMSLATHPDAYVISEDNWQAGQEAPDFDPTIYEWPDADYIRDPVFSTPFQPPESSSTASSGGGGAGAPAGSSAALWVGLGAAGLLGTVMMFKKRR